MYLTSYFPISRFEVVLGSPRSGSKFSDNNSAFVGCLSDLDMLDRALDFNTEVQQVRSTTEVPQARRRRSTGNTGNSTSFLGNVFRWYEVTAYGNVYVSSPSTAEISLCRQGQISPGCTSARGEPRISV